MVIGVSDETDLPEQPVDEDRPWLTVRRAEVALALSIAAIAAAYLLSDSGGAARFVVTFAAGAVALASLRFLLRGRHDRD
jgi:hypothetical protein